MFFRSLSFCKKCGLQEYLLEHEDRDPYQMKFIEFDELCDVCKGILLRHAYKPNPYEHVRRRASY